MSLRLAGEEFTVVQGLDTLGWPREIQANDADPALKITRNGSGPDLQFQQAAIISTSAGQIALNPAGSITLDPGNGFVNFLANFLVGRERVTPSAPAGSDDGIIYFDTSGGKTRLMVIFQTGAAQVVATQP